MWPDEAEDGYVPRGIGVIEDNDDLTLWDRVEMGVIYKTPSANSRYDGFANDEDEDDSEVEFDDE